MTFSQLHHDLLVDVLLADVAPPPEALISDIPFVGIIGGCLLTVAAVWAIVAISKRIKSTAGETSSDLNVD